MVPRTGLSLIALRKGAREINANVLLYLQDLPFVAEVSIQATVSTSQ